MKTANFKSMSWLMAFAMIVITSFSACTDEEDNKNQAPVFPEQKDLTINAGETQEFTFEANMEWALTSTAVWCKFVENSEDKVNLKGNAGTQTITIKVTDEEQTTGEASKAQLELSMGGKKQVIAEITRSAKGYELKVYDMEGNEIETLEVGYGEYAQFKVVANYRFAVPETPEFVKLEGDKLVGSTPNQEVTGGLQFVETETYSVKYPFEAGDNAERMLTFKSEDGKASKSIPLYFKGMDAHRIEMIAPQSNINWTVSLDGSRFINESSGTGSTTSTTYESPMEFEIKALNDEFQMIFMEEWSDGTIHVVRPVEAQDESTNDIWVNFTAQDKGKVKMTVTEFEQEIGGPTSRKGYVLALPKAEYEKMLAEGNLRETLTKKDEDSGQEGEDGKVIAYKYLNNGLLMEFTQKEIQETVEGQYFSAAKNNMGMAGEPVECNVYDGEFVDAFKKLYNALGVSIIPQPVTNLLVTVTDGNQFANVQAFYMDDMTEIDFSEDPFIEGAQSGFTANLKGKNRDIYLVVTTMDETDKTYNYVLIIEASNLIPEEGEVFTVTDKELKPIECVHESDMMLASQYGVTGENIWKIKQPVTNSMNMIQFKPEEGIQSVKCYNNTTQEKIELDGNIDIEHDGNGINVWLGNETSIDSNLVIIINDTYLLYIAKP